MKKIVCPSCLAPMPAGRRVGFHLSAGCLGQRPCLGIGEQPRTMYVISHPDAEQEILSRVPLVALQQFRFKSSELIQVEGGDRPVETTPLEDLRVEIVAPED